MEEEARHADAMLAANRVAMEALEEQKRALVASQERAARAVTKARSRTSRSRSLHESRDEDEVNPNLSSELSRIMREELADAKEKMWCRRDANAILM